MDKRCWKCSSTDFSAGECIACGTKYNPDKITKEHVEEMFERYYDKHGQLCGITFIWVTDYTSGKKEFITALAPYVEAGFKHILWVKEKQGITEPDEYLLADFPIKVGQDELDYLAAKSPASMGDIMDAEGNGYHCTVYYAEIDPESGE